MPFLISGKRILIGALALSLVAGSGITSMPLAKAESAALTTPFTDISKGHWAEKHVAKLALQEIITGYPTSSGTFEFRPNNKVTQEEAVLMALRFAGLEDEIDTDAIIGFPDSFSVSNFFRPYILLAFSTGLLEQGEEFALAEKDPDTDWGTKPASREWVTKLMIRAIGQEEAADQLEDSQSTFDDADQIDDRYKGYVNAASNLNLVKGVTATKFDPKANITRASLATLISRAQAQFPVDYDGQESGIVSQLSDSEITIFSDGTETTYKLDDETLYYQNTSESPISKAQLPLYGDVTIIGKEGTARYIEVTGVTPHTEMISGTLDRVIAAENKLYIWVNNEPVEINFIDDVIVNDDAGNTLELGSIKRDTPISIIRDTFRAEPLAQKIIATQQAASTVVSGTFYGSDGELVTIKRDTDLVTKFMDANVTVEIEGMTGSTISDLLKDTDQVELSLNADDKVTKIKVVNRNVKLIAGAQIASYAEDNKLLTILDGNSGSALALFFTERTKIDFGGNSMTLESAKSFLTKNRKVIVSYTGSTIVSLQFVTKYEGTLVSLNSATNLLTLRLASGASVSIPYNTAVIETPSTTSASFASLKAGDKLTLLLNADQDKVATIKVHRNLVYEITSVDAVNKKAVVKTSASSELNISLFNVEIVNESGVKLAINQLKPGMIVSAAYEGSIPVAIKTITVTYGTVQAITANSVTIASLAGQTDVWNSDAGFVIYKGAVQDSVTSLLTAGDYVEVFKSDDGKIQISVAPGESRTFANYNLLTDLVQTDKLSTTDTRNFFKVTNQTKYFQGGNAVTLPSFKSGDRITVYAFRNTAVAIVKP